MKVPFLLVLVVLGLALVKVTREIRFTDHSAVSHCALCARQ